MGKTFTSAPRSGASIQRVISGESFTGDGIGHRADGGESAGGSGRRSGRNRFFVRLPGLAQMHMQVDESGRNDAAARIQRLLGLPRSLPGGSDRGDAPVAQQHVHLLINAAGRIDHVSADLKSARLSFHTHRAASQHHRQYRHARLYAVPHLFVNTRLRPVGYFAGQLHSANDGPGMHQNRVWLRQPHSLRRDLIMRDVLRDAMVLRRRAALFGRAAPSPRPRLATRR